MDYNNINDVTVNTSTGSYNISFKKSFDGICQSAENAGLMGRRLIVVTDNNVEEIYKNDIYNAASKCFSDVDFCTFKAGEKSKNINVVEEIYDKFLELKADRKTVIAGFGGGVTGDMAGFAAATFMRGLDFIQIPTTLLAQVDSSVGGKVGIDYKGKKNLVGAFYQPRFVYINTNTLKTLPKREFAAGMAEVIKYGVIVSKDFYNSLILKKSDINENIGSIISECCKFKADVVSADEKESGLREILNFGHTIGHAVESLKNFELIHGECVGIGMSAAMYMSHVRGNISESELCEFNSFLDYLEIPRKVSGLMAEDIYNELFKDKKVKNSRLTFVLIESIGKCYRTSDVSKDEIIGAIKYVLEV